ncbi:hypothetical protein PsorP6_016575 [Peronosclerospora sorghi]|uniref:Uncharacterized protein n=1 Tax=Peronosclerospora sorghi TaxID=230839 RepID=A0ACC0VMJ3_9STRA|nr:hypothetical protein PsorP6_016575 [Peronosclerospora sorghi]
MLLVRQHTFLKILEKRKTEKEHHNHFDCAIDMDADELQERILDFIRTREALRDEESSALRDQVYDLTELLAAFDLCELHDPHLIAVRDRAFQREITADIELPIQVQSLRRELQQLVTPDVLITGSIEQTVGNIDTQVPEYSDDVRKTDSKVEFLQERIELLERDIVILRLRQELLEETTPRLESATANYEDDGIEIAPGQEDLGVFDDHRNESTTAMQEQDDRIAYLENALEMESAKNAVLKQQTIRLRQVENILQDFSRRRSSFL